MAAVTHCFRAATVAALAIVPASARLSATSAAVIGMAVAMAVQRSAVAHGTFDSLRIWTTPREQKMTMAAMVDAVWPRIWKRTKSRSTLVSA